MKNWANNILLTVILFFYSISYAQAIDPPKTFTIYMILWRGETDLERGFRDYITHSGIRANYIVRDAQRDEITLRNYVAEAKAARPDLIYTFGTTVTTAVVGHLDHTSDQVNITDIPVVYTAIADPVHVGLSATETASGRNLTGVSHVVPLGLQLQTIEQLDQFKRIGFVYNAREANSRAAYDAFVPLAQKAGFSVHAAPIPLLNDKPDASRINEIIAHLAEQQVELLYMPSDSFVAAHAAHIVEQAHRHHMITFAATEPPIRDAGALIGIVSRYYTVGRLAGQKAKQILVDKVPPGLIPLEPISRYSFLVNLDAAHSLNYYPPVTVLEYAEIVTRTP
jgi:putative tryptophan/tyrosine transport system substrate-binding protein